MATSDVRLVQACDLSQLTTADLDPVLAEEIDVWRTRYSWDFRPSADLLRRFLQVQALYGSAVRTPEGIVGYSYYVCEGRKALIGGFYSSMAEAELPLLESVLNSIFRVPGVKRVESQLMLLQTPPESVDLPMTACATHYDRYFMEIGSAAAEALAPASLNMRVRFVPFHEKHMEEMAHLLAASYRGHIDSEINDQYRNIPGARQFLSNIIRFPGCGRFAPSCSVLAIDENSNKLCGMCLTSNVSETAGHITQLCVLPALRRAHLGYELLRRALRNLIDWRSTLIGLTVTCSNADAVRLYRSLGFRVISTFPALVWDRS